METMDLKTWKLSPTPQESHAGRRNAEARCQPEEDLVSGKELSQLSEDLSDHLAGETLAVAGGSLGW